jgi:hypothetical protein
MTRKEDRDKKFLRNIEDTEIVWTFQLSGNRKITGRVIGFLWTSEGIPITIHVEAENGSETEIPWSAIHTITYIKGMK